MNYRFDIASLRSLAIILVVLFHYEIALFKGGFIGVDIFFVLSGYLMTRIIIEKQVKGDFSIMDFFMSRVNRLLPALAFMIIVVSVYLFFFELPSILRNFGKNSLVSLIPVSNWVYMSKSGYFDVSQFNINLLLHTWSLSVEWQFYILFPFVISFAFLIKNKKDGVKNSFILCSILLLLSLSSTFALEANYYNTIFRGWELLAGSMVYFSERKKALAPRFKLFLLFIVLLPFCAIMISPSDHWPNISALLVIFITVFTLLIGNLKFDKQSTFIFKAVNYVSERSYSIYLWHWPVFHLLNKQALAAIVLTFIFAEITYRFIETPLRKKSIKYFVLNVLLVGVVTIISFLSFKFMLTPYAEKISPLPNNVIAADRALTDKDPRKDRCLNTSGSHSANCVYPREKDSYATVLLGDSHASSLITAIESSKFGSNGILLVAKAGCLINDGSIDNRLLYKEDCKTFTESNIRNFKDKNIFISSRWPLYENRISTPNDYSAFFNVACSLSKENKVSIISSTPEFDYLVPNKVAQDLLLGHEDGLPVKFEKVMGKARSFEFMLREKASHCDFNILSPEEYLCDGKMCKTSIRGMPSYFDDNHLSESGNKILVDMFNKLN